MPIGATKPEAGVVPTWASNLGATRVEPSAGQKATGWTNGQRPPFNIFNWLLGVITDWLQYFETATDELNVEKIDRDGSVTMDGNLIPSAANTRQVGTAGVPFDVMLARTQTSTVVTTGPTFDPLLSPSKTTAQTNKLSQANTPKAWGSIFSDDNALSGSDGFLDGHNIASVAYDDAANGILLVTLASAMSSVTYIVVANVHLEAPNQWFVCRVSDKGANSFKIRVKRLDIQDGVEAVSTVDLTTEDNVLIDFLVFGRQ